MKIYLHTSVFSVFN